MVHHKFISLVHAPESLGTGMSADGIWSSVDTYIVNIHLVLLWLRYQKSGKRNVTKGTANMLLRKIELCKGG